MSYPVKDKAGVIDEETIDVRVKLGPKKSVTILDMRKPSNDY